MTPEKLSEDAARPARERIRRLALITPEKTHPLLEQISLSFYKPKDKMSMIRRRANASDWHCRVFRREIGLTPGDLLRACRLDMAIPVLRETTMTTRRIARLVGYRSTRPLEKQIRASWDCSPKQFRERLREVHPDHRAQTDELLSWYFWVRYRRGDIESSDWISTLRYIHGRFRPS